MEQSSLIRELLLQILRTRICFRQSLQRALKKGGIEITFEMLQVMNRLWSKQGVSHRYLAEQTEKDKTGITNLVDNLEKRGWVTRKQDANDRRHKLIYLTTQGEALAGQVRPILQTMYASIGANMNGSQMRACIEELKQIDETLIEYANETVIQ